MNTKNLAELPSNEDISLFRERLVKWFAENGRDYPWRKTGDPFKILIAEMMLRRTKADQVREVYSSLFARFPDADAMAEAREEELEQILYPLGLKWRTPAFGCVAREIKEKYDCRVPETRDELRALPGVGEYVAGAVLSIGYGKAEWVVDSNVVRVFKRYFGISTSREGRRDKNIIHMAKVYASEPNARTANLAILDFAALVCSPKNPDYAACPFKSSCKSTDRESHKVSR
jgi:A/G-specific adenine glycosylase